MIAVGKSDSAIRYRAFDSYYHANAKGTGSALKLELHPAYDDEPGFVLVSLAAQKTQSGVVNGVQAYATFDWENGICMKLGRSDLAMFLEVLRGMKESVLDGKGLFHRSGSGTCVIKFAHQIDPRPGYVLSSWKTRTDGTQAHGYFIFDVCEALALMLALERAMMYVCFGIPEIMPWERARAAAARMDALRRADGSDNSGNAGEVLRAASGDAF